MIQSEEEARAPFLDRVESRVTGFFGSRFYIFGLATMTICWMIFNSSLVIDDLHTGVFDPYPFILLNLVFSTVAAFQQPMILMTAKRAEVRAAIQERESFLHTREYRDHMVHSMDLIVASAVVQQDLNRRVEIISRGLAALLEQSDIDEQSATDSGRDDNMRYARSAKK
jgi:uncharacterized membrane protein